MHIIILETSAIILFGCFRIRELLGLFRWTTKISPHSTNITSLCGNL